MKLTINNPQDPSRLTLEEVKILPAGTIVLDEDNDPFLVVKPFDQIGEVHMTKTGVEASLYLCYIGCIWGPFMFDIKSPARTFVIAPSGYSMTLTQE